MTTPESAAPRRPGSLTEWLRGRSDAQLAELIRRRPDLGLPAPPDLATLASRMSVRTSVQRCVDGLDAFTLRVLEALALTATDAGTTTLDDATRLLGTGVAADAVQTAFGQLVALGLVWGEPDAAHLVAPIRDSLGVHPAGLGRPAAVLFAQVPDVLLAPVLRRLGLPPASQPRAGEAVTEVLEDPDRLAALLAEADDDETEVLSRLASGPPIGIVRDTHVRGDDSDLPAPLRLVLRGLLVPLDQRTVELPREVAVALRPSPLGEVSAQPPEVPVVEREPAELDRTGTTAVLEFLRLVDSLADTWTFHPPAQLRSGGLGVRDLRRTAKDLGVDEATVALIVEVAAAAGLLNATHSVEPVYLPTPEFDTWRRHDPAQRWTDLALAWLAMTRQPSLVSQRGERERLITALSPDAERGTIPALRRQVLQTLAELPPGAAPTDREAVLARLAWQAPRRASGQRPLAEAVLVEADVLGVTAAGGLTGYSRTLLSGSRTVAEQVLAGALPEPVEHFLVQPDLTVVVPGPLTRDLAAELTLAADLESSGGASVYRITEASVRRALDAGRSGTDIAAFMAQRSRTPVPQSLTYLIDDLARRHGALRSGAASSYLRSDDEALLARVLSDRGTSSLQLRRIAPTVLVSTAPVARVLDVLRETGYAPAAEAPDGEVISLGVEAARAPSRPPARVVRSRATDSGGQLGELIQRVRSGDALTELSRRVQPIAQQVPGVTSAATMGLLRDAIRAGQRILLGVAETDGTASRHELLPISMAGGFVRGHEPGASRLSAYPLHRITAVSAIVDPDADPDPDVGPELEIGPDPEPGDA